MTSVGEAGRGIFGAWRLLHGDRSGLRWFDTSITGYWRSFAAAIVALPAYVALVGLSAADYPGEIQWSGLIAVEAIAYLIDWFAFPLAAVYICNWMGKGAEYTRLIVALNWAKVIEVAVMVPTALVASLAPGGVLAMIPVAIFIAILVYHWWVTKVALGAATGEAVMVTLINVMIGIITSLWARSLLF